MRSAQAIGIRVNKELLSQIESLSKEEHIDRSTAMRILLEEGYKNHMKKKAAEEYKEGKITMSKAAQKSNQTIWEMEQYLVCQGYRSQYSVEDLKQEVESITRQK
jgi:metal-responsive CopG/Arc/MetJ family transcriptional regulator